jgi:hypothetical protein
LTLSENLNSCSSGLCSDYLNARHTSVVLVLIHARNHFIHNISLQASIIAMNYASTVDKATHFCSFDYHDIAHSENVIKNPDVYFLKSMSPAISTICVANQFSLPTSKAQTHFESSSEISQDPLHSIPMLLSWIGQKSTINTNHVLYLLVYISLHTSSFQQLRHIAPCPSQNFNFTCRTLL